ncbi:hypothetical protein GGTG_13150 [Gaeumannomyces tritici R3-111a-1]|uniref:Uncharacterized protein n=1 Tax=Gaeumannomyces tritici (strain R3-111a-1) TaxID=644352 RepID=J3PI19_GAET3|nr:hypothetical protein GGTG_13150 [Gaeumannomyces tritici R3-111a-1]EJT69531.1 hypothetical protein GGTG_13150 [Gaeumannomyces tritici R3-111a-1]
MRHLDTAALTPRDPRHVLQVASRRATWHYGRIASRFCDRTLSPNDIGVPFRAHGLRQPLGRIPNDTTGSRGDPKGSAGGDATLSHPEPRNRRAEHIGARGRFSDELRHLGRAHDVAEPTLHGAASPSPSPSPRRAPACSSTPVRWSAAPALRNRCACMPPLHFSIWHALQGIRIASPWTTAASAGRVARPPLPILSADHPLAASCLDG